MVLKLEEEAEANQDRIKDLQKDLYESINIGKILKDKELKMQKEIDMMKQNDQDDKNQINSQIQQESQNVNESEQTKNQIKSIQQQLNDYQQEIQTLRQDLETSEQLQLAKEQQEKLLKENIQEIQLENERIKKQQEVYHNILFKLCNILPHIELEHLINEFIQNSEQLYLAQIEQDQQEEQFQQNDDELRKSAKEDTINSRQIISKRKVVEQVRENLKTVVNKCRKFKERESYLLAEIDKISQLEKQRIDKSMVIEREFYKMKSLMQYEQKRNEALTSRQTNPSPNNLHLKQSNLNQNSNYNYNDQQSQRNNQMSSSDLELQKLGYYNNKENEQEQNARQFTDDDDRLIFNQSNNQSDRFNAQQQKNKIAKQQSLSRQISSSLIDPNKDKIINNLISSNISLRNNLAANKNSSSSNSLITNQNQTQPFDMQYSMLGTQDKNTLLRMKLEDKLLNSKRNMGLTYKYPQL